MQLPSLSVLLQGLLVIFFLQSLHAQHSPVYDFVQTNFEKHPSTESIMPFSILHEQNQEALKIVPKAQFLTLDQSVTAQIAREKPETITLRLPFKNNILTIDLVRVEITTADFSVITEAGNTPQTYISGAHYRGVLRGNTQSLAAISFYENEIMGGIYAAQTGNLVLGRLDERDNKEHYVLYAEHEMSVHNPFSCATDDNGKPEEHPAGAPEITKCVRVFLEADNELFLNKGSSVQETVNYLVGMFNQSAVLYANEQIPTIVSQIFVWTTPDVYATTSSATVLNQFKAFRTSFNGDLAHLVGLGGNNLGGIAFVDVLCSSYNVAFSNISTTYSNVPVYSWTVEVFTHEMGHNLGSHHTQWCGWSGGPIDNCVTQEGTCAPGPTPVNGGTVMSYCHLTNIGINFNNGFGPQPGNAIRNATANASCVAASCPVANCDAPVAISITNITGNGATIGWGTTNGATGYLLRYRAVGAAQWTLISNPSNPYQITGLPANEEVEVSVQSLCGSNSSDYKNGLIFVTGASGGSGGATCNAPSGLTAAAASSNAVITWSASNGATAYSIQWKASNSANWGNPVNTTSTSYNITNLNASTAYQVQVATVCSSATSAYSNTSFTTATGSTTCNAPSNITATPAANSAQMNWVAVSGATGYKVEWKTSASGTWSSPVTVTTNSATLNNLTASTGYDARVSTICSSSSSAYGTVSFTTTSAASCQAPLVLTTVPSKNTAQVNWSAIAGVSTYKLEWKLSTASTWSNALTVNGTTTTISGLSASTAYQIRIAAVCGSALSAFTNSIFTTSGSTSTCNAPNGFNATASINQANTSWTAVPGAIYYRIQWKTASSASWGALVSTVNPVYTINNLAAGTAYQVRVTTLCQVGLSAYTTSTFTTGVAGTSCGTPTNLAATAGTNSASVSWTAVNGAGSYSVQWKTDVSSTWSNPVSTTTANYTISGLAAGTNYNVRVAAVCGGTTSAFITTSFATTAGASCGAPSSLNITAGVTNGLAQWPLVSGVSSYQIQWKAAASAAWGPVITLATNQYNIVNLVAGTNYNVRVASICNNTVSSYVTANFTTTTNSSGGTCAVPGGLNLLGLQANAATVGWSAVSGAVSYTLRVRVSGSLNWFTFTGLPTPGVTIQSMSPSTTYEVQVSTNCGNNGSSAFSGSLIFTTPSSLEPEQNGLAAEFDYVKLPIRENAVVEAKAWPNPFKSSLQIHFDDNLETEVEIAVYNAFGQQISSENYPVNGSDLALDNLESLQTGIYFIQLKIKSETKVLRVVKQ